MAEPRLAELAVGVSMMEGAPSDGCTYLLFDADQGWLLEPDGPPPSLVALAASRAHVLPPRHPVLRAALCWAAAVLSLVAIVPLMTAVIDGPSEALVLQWLALTAGAALLSWSEERLR